MGGQYGRIVLSYHLRAPIKSSTAVISNVSPCFRLNTPFQSHKRDLGLSLSFKTSKDYEVLLEQKAMG